MLLLVENNKKAYSCMQKSVKLSLQRCQDTQEENLKRVIKTYNQNVVVWIDKFKEMYYEFNKEEQQKFLFFLDPPYQDKKIYQDVLDKLLGDNWYMGELWIESDRLKGIPLDELRTMLEKYDGKKVHKTYKQGDHYFAVVY